VRADAAALRAEVSTLRADGITSAQHTHELRRQVTVHPRLSQHATDNRRKSPRGAS
jgi:hypothetical protein